MDQWGMEWYLAVLKSPFGHGNRPAHGLKSVGV